MYLELMGNFLEFFRNDVKGAFVANNLFDSEAYIESIKDERREFMKEFVNTQNFNCFIETAYKTRTQRNELSCFINGAKILQISGKLSLALYYNQIVDCAITSYNNVNVLNYIIASYLLSRRMS